MSFTSKDLMRSSDGFNAVSTKTVEKIKYKGMFRIIGLVSYAGKNDKYNTVGYAIMEEKNYSVKMYTVQQTKMLLSKFKFVNAELKNGEIINTECSMSRLYVFDTNMNIIKNNDGIIIIGEIISNGKKCGYRVLDNHCVIVDLKEKELIELAKKNTIINGKVIPESAGKKGYISAIKQEYTKIEKSQVKVPVEKKLTNADIWRRKKHIEKLVNKVLPLIIKRALYDPKLTPFSSLMFSTKLEKGINYRYLDIDKEARIIIKEIYNDEIVKLTDKDKELLNKILSKCKHQKQIGYELTSTGKLTYKRHTEQDAMFISVIAQFLLNNDEARASIEKAAFKRKFFTQSSFRIGEEMIKLGLASDKFKETFENIQNSWIRRSSELHVNAKPKRYVVVSPTFRSGQDIAEFGFTINKEYDNQIYSSKTGRDIKLKYIGNNLSEDYIKQSRCLGDMLALVNLDKILNKIEENKQGYRRYLTTSRLIASAEMIIAISYLYNSPVMKKFVDENFVRIAKNGVNIPDYDTISSTDYQLSPGLVIYYQSGFNVFFNDAKYHEESRLDSREVYINYRAVGNKYIIEHPMLTEELASIVTMVTSDNCDAQTVEDYIGSIRFI